MNGPSVTGGTVSLIVWLDKSPHQEARLIAKRSVTILGPPVIEMLWLLSQVFS